MYRHPIAQQPTSPAPRVASASTTFESTDDLYPTGYVANTSASTTFESTEDLDATGYVANTSASTSLETTYTSFVDDVTNERDISQSFMVEVSYLEQRQVLEESITDSLPEDSVVEDGPIRYEVLSGASQRGNDLLSDNMGYMDTVNVVREPFSSLLTIHASVRRGECAKPIPLIFVIMSGRRTIDYVKVLKKIGRLLDGRVSVVDFVVDFEAALWNSIRHIFEDAEIHGCCFH